MHLWFFFFSVVFRHKVTRFFSCLVTSLLFHRLWVVCILRCSVWHLLNDHTHDHRGGSIHRDHSPSGFHRRYVTQTRPGHTRRCVAVLNGLESASFLRMEWVKHAHVHMHKQQDVIECYLLVQAHMFLKVCWPLVRGTTWPSVRLYAPTPCCSLSLCSSSLFLSSCTATSSSSGPSAIPTGDS